MYIAKGVLLAGLLFVFIKEEKMKRIVSILLAFILAVSLPMCVAPATQAATKLVAITFDDGPSGYTAGLLDGLKARGAKATFFMVGDRVNAYAGTVRRMLSEGHQIANHTVTHPDLSGLSYSSVQWELSTCESRLRAIGGQQVYAIRPPYGSYNSNVRQAANGPLILWSVDTLDWQSRNADAVYNKIMNNTRDGSIVLLHDLYSTSVQGALRAIDSLKAQGYEFVTVNELFRRRGITMQKGAVYTCAYNKGITLPAAEAPAAPTIKVSDVMGGKKVTLSTTTKDAAIYYTLDGSAPSEKSTKYTKAFTVKQSTTVRAVAYKELLSEEKKQSITVSLAPAPTASYKKGKLTLKAAEGTTLYYTTDNTVPTDKSTAYTAPIDMSKVCSVLVRAKGQADRTVTYTLTEYGALFTDISHKAWYYKAVGEAVERGIMKGTGKQTFAPEDTVTRAMLVTALYRLSPDAEKEFASADFTDIKAGSWYSDALNWGVATGIVKGMSDTSFAPDDIVTREQMCAFIRRYLDYYEIVCKREKREALQDAQDIASWARKDVQALYEMKLINGMGNGLFCPKEGSTRAQIAKILVDVDTL